ncbi:MAG: MerR family transcriptional regulator [Rikenellaceae bacterium]
MESKKLYYSMGEVSELFCVAPSLIRYWEKHFSVIKPVRNKKGNRLFTPTDVENFKIIYHLVKERGMTLEGAQRTMKQNRKGYSRDAELLERMQHIRAMLLEVREELKEPALKDAEIKDTGTKEFIVEEFEEKDIEIKELGDIGEESRENNEWLEEKMIDFKDNEESFRCTIYLGADDNETNDDNTEGEEGDKPESGDPIDHSARNTNRTPDAQSKELFAFYEQSLF